MNIEIDKKYCILKAVYNQFQQTALDYLSACNRKNIQKLAISLMPILLPFSLQMSHIKVHSKFAAMF